jgi:hypothetical protein
MSENKDLQSVVLDKLNKDLDVVKQKNTEFTNVLEGTKTFKEKILKKLAEISDVEHKNKELLTQISIEEQQLKQLLEALKTQNKAN